MWLGGRATVMGGAGMVDGSWVGVDLHARSAVAGVIEAATGEGLAVTLGSDDARSEASRWP
jgi:hypothetical protein